MFGGADALMWALLLLVRVLAAERKALDEFVAESLPALEGTCSAADSCSRHDPGESDQADLGLWAPSDQPCRNPSRLWARTKLSPASFALVFA